MKTENPSSSSPYPQFGKVSKTTPLRMPTFMANVSSLSATAQIVVIAIQVCLAAVCYWLER
jgi:hypothetical protein